MMVFEAVKRYLQCQHLAWPCTATAAIVAVLSIVLNYTLIVEMDLGLRGAAISVAICNWVLLLALIGILKIRTVVLRRRLLGQHVRLINSREPSPTHSQQQQRQQDMDTEEKSLMDHPRTAASEVGSREEITMEHELPETWPSWSMDVFKQCSLLFHI